MKRMKRLFAFLCVFALAAVTVSLAACGGTDTPPPPPEVKVSLDKTTASVEEGATVTLTATVTNSTENPVFKSSDAAKATVTSSGKTATVTGVAAGTVTITASAGGKSADCKVTVTAKPAPELTIDKEFVIMEDGGDALNTATVTATATGDAVTFKSSDEEVVSVAVNGKTATLTAHKTGAVTLTVTSGEIVKTCSVEVGTFGLAYELTQLPGETEGEFIDVLQVKSGSAELAGDIRIPSKYWNDDEEAYFDVAVIKPRVIDGTTRVSDGAFEGNETITSVYLGDNVINVGDNAFTNCTGLISVKCGPSLKSVGGGAFDNCESLASFDWADSKPTFIGGASFRFVALTEFVIPETATAINYGMFQGAASLVTVKIYAPIEIIFNDTFLQCLALKDIYLPVSLTSVQQWAFGLYAGMPDDGREFTVHYAGTEAQWDQVEIAPALNETIIKGSNSKLTLEFEAEY